MSNPFFSRSTAFQEGGHAPGAAPAQTPNGYPTMPGYQAGQYGQQAAGYGQQYGQYGNQYANQYGQQAAGYGQVSPEQMAGLEAQYQAPSATNADMRRMTYDDVIIRTAGMFALILALGALSWDSSTPSSGSPAPSSSWPTRSSRAPCSGRSPGSWSSCTPAS